MPSRASSTRIWGLAAWSRAIHVVSKGMPVPTNRSAEARAATCRGVGSKVSGLCPGRVREVTCTCSPPTRSTKVFCGRMLTNTSRGAVSPVWGQNKASPSKASPSGSGVLVMDLSLRISVI